MRVLLDTNIVIHRENKRVTNYSVGHLFRWLDKLKCDKVIHPFTIDEIKKYRDIEVQAAMSVKLDSYEVIKSIREPDDGFIALIGQPEKNDNDYVDDCLLYEVYLGRVDLLVTEDRRLRKKAELIGLSHKVYSINGFIEKASEENPELIEYKALAVEKTCFGAINVKDSFFDSLRESYEGFDKWFARKSDEEAYICKDDGEKILGFLYLKTEDETENYSDIEPPFAPKRRLKVGTLKVESTGFRLGERFIKILFDNALIRRVDEIYVTLYTDRSDLIALEELLIRWGFFHYGYKINNGKKEKVLLKQLQFYDHNASPLQNFPLVSYSCRKCVLPIKAEFHTALLPDSQLRTEKRVDFLGRDAHRYALQKIYITWASAKGVQSGDLILFYRMAPDGEQKKYKSVVTTIALVDEIITDIHSEEELLRLCNNRSVFSAEQLKNFWKIHKTQLKVLKFVFVKSLTKRLTLGYLWDHNIVPAPGGPRPFDRLSDEQFNMILRDSETEIEFVDT